MISNCTSISQIFSRLAYKFDLLFSTRAFVHWFMGEGLESGEFFASRNNLSSLEMDYKELESNINNE